MMQWLISDFQLNFRSPPDPLFIEQRIRISTPHSGGWFLVDLFIRVKSSYCYFSWRFICDSGGYFWVGRIKSVHTLIRLWVVLPNRNKIVRRDPSRLVSKEVLPIFKRHPGCTQPVTTRCVLGRGPSVDLP